jgi:hypothetical protein
LITRIFIGSTVLSITKGTSSRFRQLHEHNPDGLEPNDTLGADQAEDEQERNQDDEQATQGKIRG